MESTPTVERQRQKQATKATKSSNNKKPPPLQKQLPNSNPTQGSPIARSPPSTPPPPTIHYCPIPLLPTIFHSDQVCRQCSAGLLAYARRVYYFEVGCMMLKMPTRVTQERKLYSFNGKEDAEVEDGVDRSLEYYEKNIIDRILPPATLLKCWVAWRQDREHFRLLAVCGGADEELGQGFRGFDNEVDDQDVNDDEEVEEGDKDNSPAGSDFPSFSPSPFPNPFPFPQEYFFDDFLGGIIISSLNLRSRAEIEAEEALQRKLRLLDAVVEARCLEAFAQQQQQQQQDWEWELEWERRESGSDLEGELGTGGGREGGRKEELGTEAGRGREEELSPEGGWEEERGLGLGLGELIPILKRAVELRRFCEVTAAVEGVGWGERERGGCGCGGAEAEAEAEGPGE